MFKVTENGIEQGEVLELTEEDHEEILAIFEEASNLAPTSKDKGMWKNENNNHIDIGFQLSEHNLEVGTCLCSEV